MPPPEPIENINLRGDRVLLAAQRADGKWIPLRVNDDGSLLGGTADPSGGGSSGPSAFPTPSPVTDTPENPGSLSRVRAVLEVQTGEGPDGEVLVSPLKMITGELTADDPALPVTIRAGGPPLAVEPRPTEAALAFAGAAGCAIDQIVAVRYSKLPEGASTSALQQATLDMLDARLPQGLQTSGGRLLVDIGAPVVTLAAGSSVTIEGGTIAVTGNVGADLRVGGAAVSGANPVPVGGTVSISGTPTVAVSGAVQVTDGSGPLTVDISGTPSVSISGTPTVSISGGSVAATVTDGSGALTVDGTVNADLRVGGAAVASGNPVPVSGSVSAAVTGTVAISGGSISATISDGSGPVTVDGTVSVGNFPATQAVSGTVTANVGTTNGLALDATLTGGTARSVVRGGAKGTTGAGDVTSTAEGADRQALDVQLYHGGSAVNPTQTRALTAADVVTADVRVASLPVSGANPVPTAVQNFPATQAVSAASLPLPTGASTSALQSTANTSLANIDSKTPAPVNGRQPVDGSGVTQPISAVSLPLPSNAAQEHVTAASPHAVRITADGVSFVSAANALPTRPDALGRTLDGSTRAKIARSLSYVRHAPPWMVSLGGTSARHEFMDQQSVSGGTLTYLPNTQSVRLAVPATSGARQSYRQRIWNPYKPGSPMRPAWNFVADTHRAGVVYRAGIFDDFDGLYIERNDSGTFFVTRSYTSGSVVNSSVALAGVDISLANLYRLAYEWFGAGDRELVVNGVLALSLPGGGNATVPYMRRPNLPMTFEIVNNTGANSSYLDVVCIEVESEGEQDFLIRDGTYTTTAASIGVGGKLLFQGRPAASLAVGTISGLDNRAVYIPRSVTCSTTSGPAVIRVYDNGVPTGTPAWAANSDDAGMEFDTAATFVGATGRLIGFDTIDNATGTATISLSNTYRIPGRALSAGAYSGQDSIQVVGFARTGTITSLDTIFSYHRIG